MSETPERPKRSKRWNDLSPDEQMKRIRLAIILLGCALFVFILTHA